MKKIKVLHDSEGKAWDLYMSGNNEQNSKYQYNLVPSGGKAPIDGFYSLVYLFGIVGFK
jgi:hypothetical protein